MARLLVNVPFDLGLTAMGGKFGIMEIVLILLVVVLLFGGKKIPELMRGLGKGMKEFKDAKDGVEKDGDSK